MKDRYLFRGKRVDNGEWVVGNLAIIPDGKIEIGTKCIDPPDCDPMWQKVLITYEVIPETVGQCTGLKDKNGKLIFEGDICKHRSNYSGNSIVSVVTYTDGHFLALVNKHSRFELSEKLEVIGKYPRQSRIVGGEMNNDKPI